MRSATNAVSEIMAELSIDELLARARLHSYRCHCKVTPQSVERAPVGGAPNPIAPKHSVPHTITSCAGLLFSMRIAHFPPAVHTAPRNTPVQYPYYGILLEATDDAYEGRSSPLEICNRVSTPCSGRPSISSSIPPAAGDGGPGGGAAAGAVRHAPSLSRVMWWLSGS